MDQDVWSAAFLLSRPLWQSTGDHPWFTGEGALVYPSWYLWNPRFHSYQSALFLIGGESDGKAGDDIAKYGMKARLVGIGLVNITVCCDIVTPRIDALPIMLLRKPRRCPL
jgi:hypothetical protein